MTTVKDYFHFQIIFLFEEKVTWIILQKEKTTSKHCPLWNKKMITLHFHPTFYCLNTSTVESWQHRKTKQKWNLWFRHCDGSDFPFFTVEIKKQQEHDWGRTLEVVRWRMFFSWVRPKAFIKLKGQCRRIKDGQETEGLLSVLFSCKFSFFLLFGRKDTESHNKGKDTKIHFYFNPFSLCFILHYSHSVFIYNLINTSLQTVSASIFYSLWNNSELVQPIFPSVCVWTVSMFVHVYLSSARA